jgi:hypothetical protein
MALSTIPNLGAISAAPCNSWIPVKSSAAKATCGAGTQRATADQWSFPPAATRKASHQSANANPYRFAEFASATFSSFCPSFCVGLATQNKLLLLRVDVNVNTTLSRLSLISK